MVVVGSAIMGARDGAGGSTRLDSSRWMRRAGLRQCMDHDAVAVGQARGLVGGEEMRPRRAGGEEAAGIAPSVVPVAEVPRRPLAGGGAVSWAAAKPLS